MFNLKTIFLTSLGLFCCFVSTAAQDENYFYLVNAQNLQGITGNITTPSPHTTPKNKLVFGLHRFEISISYGIISYCETGLNFDLKQFSSLESQQEDSDSSIGIHTKYHLIRQYPGNKYFDFSLGINNQVLYVIAGKQFDEILNTVFQTGIDHYEDKVCYFVALVQPIKYSCFILDYSSRTGESNFGWRVLLSPDVKLDIFLTDITQLKSLFTNFVFGLTLVS
jgi:hypothetical protein